MVWIMLAITVVCVVIVFAIVMAQKEKGALVKQARAVTKDMVYEKLKLPELIWLTVHTILQSY